MSVSIWLPDSMYSYIICWCCTVVSANKHATDRQHPVARSKCIGVCIWHIITTNSGITQNIDKIKAQSRGKTQAKMSQKHTHSLIHFLILLHIYTNWDIVFYSDKTNVFTVLTVSTTSVLSAMPA